MFITELTRKQLSQMFFKGEIEKEIRNPKYPERMKWVMKADGDIDDMMERVVEEQSQTLYEHQETPHCPDKGSNNYYYSTLDITMIFYKIQAVVDAGQLMATGR